MTLRTVHLHGALAGRFGARHRIAVATPVEAFRALAVLRPGFRQAVSDGAFRIVRGDLYGGIDLDGETLGLRLGTCDLHVVPVLAGAGGRGTGKIILGAAIIGLAVWAAPAAPLAAGGLEGAAASGLAAEAFTAFGTSVTWGNIAGVGVAMALAGVSQMLSPLPRVSDYALRERPEARPSFLFNGSLNTSEQGGPVPLGFGRFRVGSVVVSAGLAVEQI
ncbi:MAG: tail assembly protein [Alphaproteobacteria bacterium]